MLHAKDRYETESPRLFPKKAFSTIIIQTMVSRKAVKNTQKIWGKCA